MCWGLASLSPAPTLRAPVQVSVRTLSLVALIFLFLGAIPHVRLAAGAPSLSMAANAWTEEDLGGIDRDVFHLALSAAACALRSGDVTDLQTLTVIDYSRPSTAKRLWVFDLRERSLLYQELVAHGSGSGMDMATAFSNEPESHQSSLGLFRTDTSYVGRNGYSLRLHGLDEGFNHLAYERAIVMHGAPYVSEDAIRRQGRLGRSWGCPALRAGVAREVIDTVKGNGLVFGTPQREVAEVVEVSRRLLDLPLALTL